LFIFGNVKFPNETLRLYFYRRRIIGFNDGLQNGAIRIFTDKSILLLDENTKKPTTELVFLENNDSLWEQSISKNGIRLCLPMKLSQDLDLQPYHYNMVKG
jgi:hypothetical protein